MSTTAVNPAATTTWKLDPAHSAAEFKVKQMMIANVKGRFSGLSGDLTLHGVTKSVTVDVEGLSEPAKDPWGNLRIGLSATARVNRKDFGLTWNAALETGGILVGEDIAITLEVQFIKA